MTLIFCGCKKESPPFSAAPEISFIEISPAIATAFQDSITVIFSYKDGDGDLGENNANAENLFLTDNRINLEYKYRIKQLAPEGKQIPIKGTLSVILKNTSLTDSSNQQTATFSIYVKDRAGNISNTITSTPIEIVKN
jgi:hypothetical protein